MGSIQFSGISPLGIISSETGVQQGDPLGPLLFSLVLHRVVSAIASNCPELLFHMWYLDDGTIAGPKLAVLHALSIVQDLGPPNDLFVNISKCELYSTGDLSIFPSEMKYSKKNSTLKSWVLQLETLSSVPNMHLTNM